MMADPPEITKQEVEEVFGSFVKTMAILRAAVKGQNEVDVRAILESLGYKATIIVGETKEG